MKKDIIQLVNILENLSKDGGQLASLIIIWLSFATLLISLYFLVAIFLARY